jgi:group II intron reverse transcriptase/maturase
MSEAQDSTGISTRLARIAEIAERKPGVGLETLAHHIDIEWLREAYRRTRKDGAVGVDGQTAAEYAEDLEGNLASLLERAKSGLYRAPLVRRVWIPKADGRELRPIGVPAFEDKVLQRAVAMVLEAVYEQDFLDCSYGFRPNRSAHEALEALWRHLMEVGGGWVIELDIRDFFGSLDRGQLRQVLRKRIRDGVLLRLIGKWLHAGVMEGTRVTYPEAGTPQGGVVSPILSNVFLHEVLDEWFEREVRPRMRGKAYLVRFADDAVLVFQCREDAERVRAVLGRRFEKYGLTLHPEKTRLVAFGRPRHRGKRGSRGFTFLGFTHYWGRSRRGAWVVRRKTASARLSRALGAIGQWCRWNRHLPVEQQWRMLSWKVRGHDAYYGITGNMRALRSFHRAVERVWRKWLARRGGRRPMPWDRFARLLRRYPLPRAVIVHRVA